MGTKFINYQWKDKSVGASSGITLQENPSTDPKVIRGWTELQILVDTYANIVLYYSILLHITYLKTSLNQLHYMQHVFLQNFLKFIHLLWIHELRIDIIIIIIIIINS
jgi:hypothetical protein